LPLFGCGQTTLVLADNAPGWSLLRVEDTQNLLLANSHPMMPRIGCRMGRLVNYDPRASFMLTEGPIRIGSLEQFALYHIAEE
jgi:hypothetical protein